MATNSSLGTAWIQIKPSVKGISGSIKKDLGGEMSGAEAQAEASSNKIASLFNGVGNTIKSTFASVGKAAVTAFSTAGIAAAGAAIGIGKSAVSAYADWEQLIGGVDTLFKGAANTVDEYSQKAFKTAGMSANAYMETVTSFSASLLQSLGGDTAKAAKYADSAVIDMSDNANKMGTDIERIQDAYQGFAKQNYTMLDNLKLGYGGTKTEMERLLADAGKLSGIKFNIDSFADITEAIHIVQDNLGITGTTAKEAEETISGSLGMVKASWQNLLTFMGGGTSMTWEEVFPAFIDSVKTFAANLAPVISSVAINIGDLFKELAPIIAAELPNLMKTLVSTISSITAPIIEVLPDVISAITDALVELLSDTEQVNQLIDGFVKLFIAFAAGAGRVVTAIAPLLPGIIGQIIDSFASEFSKPENAEPIIAGFGILLGATTLKKIGSNLLSGLKNSVGSKLTGFFKKDVGTDVAGQAGGAIKKISTTISSTVSGMGSALSAAFKTIGEVLSSAIGAIMEPIKTLLSGVGEAIAGFFSAFADPAILVGAVMFTAAAAAISAAIFLIGTAVGAITPTIIALFNEVLIPMADFVANTVLTIISTLTTAVVELVNAALIPLGEFLVNSFVAIVDTVTDALVKLTQNALIPLINTLSGAFTSIIDSVANLINTTLKTALDGIAKLVEKVGDSFTKMGEAIKMALDGVNGILSTFKDLILGIADAIVAVVALATGQSINYGSGFAHVTKAATGGRVEGIGTATSDSNLYALSKGEYVIRAAAAQQIGYDKLDELNQTGGLSGRTISNQFIINGYNKSPEELANIVSRKIALDAKGVMS